MMRMLVTVSGKDSAREARREKKVNLDGADSLPKMEGKPGVHKLTG
jgi:hypothetical protein